MKGYMAGSRGVSADRIITVDGGVAPCLTQELWIVSPGSAPQPRSEAWSNYYKPSVYKFDEHSYGYRNLYYWQDSFDELLEAFGVELQKNPKSLGYLIAYRNSVRHTPRVIQNLLRRERNFLIKQFGIKPARLKLISGGNREWTTIELWIAQEPGAFPIITSYRSARIGRRR